MIAPGAMDSEQIAQPEAPPRRRVLLASAPILVGPADAAAHFGVAERTWQSSSRGTRLGGQGANTGPRCGRRGVDRSHRAIAAARPCTPCADSCVRDPGQSRRSPSGGAPQSGGCSRTTPPGAGDCEQGGSCGIRGGGPMSACSSTPADLHQCSATTRTGRPCPMPADRIWAGRPVCHVHDPAGTCQRNLALVRHRDRTLPLFEGASR